MKNKNQPYRYSAKVGFTTEKDASPQFKIVDGIMKNLPDDWEGEKAQKAWVELELKDSDYIFKVECLEVSPLNQSHATK